MSSADHPVISVAIIARNAEDLLPATLDSARTIADHVVVLDTGSQDRTVEVALQGGATVHEWEWQDDFAAARNACMAHVAGDWVLWLDAGETIDDETAIRLRRFVESGADPQKAYMLFVQQAPSMALLSGEQIGQLRLLPVRDDLRFVGRIREKVLPSVVAAGLQVDALSCNIQRPMEDQATSLRRARAERNLRIAQLAEQEEGPSAVLLMVQAEAYQVIGKEDQAEELYRRTIEMADRGSSETLEAYYGLLTSYDSRPAKDETQIATCLEALDVFPLDAQLLCGMGSYMIKQGRLDLAARSYELAATHGQVDPSTWHLSDIGEVAASCLALTHQLQNQPEQAQQVLEDTLAQRPDSLRLLRQLLELHVKAGNRDAALAVFERFPREFPAREAFRSAIRGALLAVERKWTAAEPYLKTAFSAGCRDSLCLRWLVVSYLTLGNTESAASILRTWRELEPANTELPAYEMALAEQAAAQPRDVRRDSEKQGSTAAVARPSSGTRDRRVRIDAAEELSPKESAAPIASPAVFPKISEPPATV